MSKKSVVEAELKRLMDKNGRITPEMVVEAAKLKSSPLYEFFEWDTKKAAKLHWLETASRLIRMVEFRETHHERVIVAPFFVRDPDLPGNERGYRAIQHVRTDADAAHDVLTDEMALVEGILRRARSVAEVLGVDETVAEIEARVSSFRGELKSKRAEVGASAA